MGKYERTNKKLDSVSPTFCIAKWKQSTIYLQTGHTHSCHHPVHHKIPADTLDEPSNLHNTSVKIEARQEMLEGKRPAECQFCWQMEDLGETSDRIMKSSLDWAEPFLHEAKSNLTADPSYLEISFDSTCNLKCLYCNPRLSTKWQEEVKAWGGYSNGHNDPEEIKDKGEWPLTNREHNQYRDAFWQWWPNLYPNLRVFRITGGEPLLSKDTWRVFKYIENHPHPQLKLVINSNLSVNHAITERLKTKVRQTKNKIHSFRLWTSAEAWGKQAEYIRYGLDWNRFINNIEDLLTNCDNTQVCLMATVNVLSMETLPQIVDYFLGLNAERRQSQIALPPIQHPTWLDPRLAPFDIRYDCVQELLKSIDRNNTIEQDERTIQRLCNYLLTEAPEYSINMRDLQTFLWEHDQRRQTDFNSVFPKLREYIQPKDPEEEYER